MINDSSDQIYSQWKVLKITRLLQKRLLEFKDMRAHTVVWAFRRQGHRGHVGTGPQWCPRFHCSMMPRLEMLLSHHTKTNTGRALSKPHLCQLQQRCSRNRALSWVFLGYNCWGWRKTQQTLPLMLAVYGNLCDVLTCFKPNKYSWPQAEPRQKGINTFIFCVLWDSRSFPAFTRCTINDSR